MQGKSILDRTHVQKIEAEESLACKQASETRAEKVREKEDRKEDQRDKA